MFKSIKFDTKARQSIQRGVDALANAVKVTLGPRGRHVLLERAHGFPIITKDGVTVAKEIEVEDAFENMGAQMVKEVASRTSDIAGDGTTTATVLAQAIFREGLKLVVAGHDPMELQRGIEAAVDHVTKQLQSVSINTRSSKEIAQVGTISANGDAAIGALIAQAMERSGKEGVITVEESRGLETELEVVIGLQFDKGYLSPYFVTAPERMEVVLDDAYILLRDRRLSSMQDLIPLLEQVARSSKPLLIIAEDVEAEALATLVVNKLRGSLKIAAVKAPDFGEGRKAILEDIAILTGGKVIADELGIKLADLTLEDLGRVHSVTVTRDSTTLVGGAGERSDIQAQIRRLQNQLQETQGEYDRGKLQQRLAKLAGGVAVIRVGAITETELSEKKARIEDALNATRAAVEEGVIAGGGVAYIRALAGLDALELEPAERPGAELLGRALEEPLRRIAENGGFDGSLVVSKVKESTQANFGFNAASGRYEDLIEAGVIDPTKVARVALRHAASIAALMLTTEVTIAKPSESSRTAANQKAVR